MSDPVRCLVFGGSGALGSAVCRAVHAGGGRLAFTYHAGRASAEELRCELPGAIVLQADLASMVEVERAVEGAADVLRGLDAFVHCAALCLSPGDPRPNDSNQRMEDVSEPGWDRIMAVNVQSAFFGCRYVAPHLRREGGGNIVLVGSINTIKPLPSPVHYATSKGALVGMTRALARELGPDKIRVNLVTPGLLETGIANSLPARLRQEYIRHCGLGRVGTMDEIAAVIAWLVQANTYVTGQSLVMDGAL
jgi:NAD(P)-dependent dehydrogenase (short-subunit alcohol dehydrogenase family)